MGIKTGTKNKKLGENENKKMQKLTVGTENIQLLEMLRTKCFQSHENY